MAWYCEHCKRHVEGNEVNIGAISIRGVNQGTEVYHTVCYQPVRAEKDDDAAAHAAQRAPASRGDDSARARGGA